MRKGAIPLIALTAVALFGLAACSCPKPTTRKAPRPPGTQAQTNQAGGPRTQLMSVSDPLFGRVEGVRYANQCKDDQSCYVGGCSAELCTAVPDAYSICEEARDWPTRGAMCGCIQGSCRWYK